MFLRVDSIYLPVRNEEEARDYYAMVVGLPELFIEDDFVGFSIGDTTLVLTECEPIPSGSMVSVVVEDLSAAVKELAERGVEIVEQGGDSPSDGWAEFDDPFGNHWTLVQEE